MKSRQKQQQAHTSEPIAKAPLGKAPAQRGNAFRQDQLRQHQAAEGDGGHSTDEPGGLPFGAEMERAFGEDFSTVKVQFGGGNLQKMGAAAATAGEEVHFSSPSPTPEQVAHELVHVVQQRHSAPAAEDQSKVDHPKDAAEEEARRLAPLAAGGQRVDVRERPSAAVQRDLGEESPQDRIKRVIADEDIKGIRKLTAEDLAQTTAMQRAGMVRILAGGMWMGAAEEQAAMTLIEHGGQAAAVVAALQSIGALAAVVSGIDDPGLAARLQALIGTEGVEVDTAPSLVETALSTRSSKAVLQLQDFTGVPQSQLLGLLQILLEMSWSNAEEEAKMIDILACAPGALMNDLRDLGLKQTLFDHVDDTQNKERLTTLLQALHDPELDADLVIFNNSALSNLWNGIKDGLSAAYDSFSIQALVQGLLAPLLSPLATLATLAEQGSNFLQDPDLDGFLSFFRDLTGTIGIWLLAAAGICGGVGGLLTLATVTAPAGLAILAFAGTLTTLSGYFGLAFVILAGLKLFTDLGQTAAATTAREHERESAELGEDFVLTAVVLAFMGMFRGLKAVTQRLRGAAVDPKGADPKALEKTKAELDQAKEDAKTNVEDLPKETDSGKGDGTTEPKTTEPKTTEPKTTEPKTTEPKTTEPKTAEPKTTEPVEELGTGKPKVRGYYEDGKPALEGNIVPSSLEMITRLEQWVKGLEELKQDIGNGRVYQRRIFVETPQGEKLVIDIDYTNHGRSDHPAPHYHVYRWRGGSWSKKGSGIPSTGQKGLPEVSDGVFNGPQPWN